MPDFETLTVRVKGEASSLDRMFSRLGSSARRWSSGMTAENDKAQRSFSETGKSVEEVTVNLTDFQRVGSATVATLPSLVAGVGAIVPAAATAAQGIGALGTAVGAGAAGFLLYGKTAYTAARVGLTAYRAAVTSAVTASREAYLATHKNVEAQLDQYRQTKLNTAASNEFNGAVDRLTRAQIDLQAAVGNRVFPTFTKWINLVLSNREALQRPFLEMITNVTRAGDSFVTAVSKGEQFQNVLKIMRFVSETTSTAATHIAAWAQTGVKIAPLLIKPTEEFIRKVTQVSAQLNTFVRSSQGMHAIGQALAYASDQMNKLWNIGKNLITVVFNVGRAMGWASTGSSILSGLAGVVRGLAQMTAKGTEGAHMLANIGQQANPILKAMWSLFKEVAVQAGIMVRNMMGAKDAASGLNPLIPVLHAIQDSVAPLRRLFQNTFIDLAPALANLIPQLAKLAETFAGSSNAQLMFINTVARLLGIFNRLPGPVKNVVMEMVAWNMIMKSVSGQGIVGMISSVAHMIIQMRIARATTALARGETLALGNASILSAAKQKAAAVATAVWTAALKAAAIAGRILRLVTFTMLGPIGLLVAAAILVGYVIYKNWDKIKAASKALWQVIKQVFHAIVQFVVAQAKATASNTIAEWRALYKGVSAAITAVKNFVGNIVSGIKNFVIHTFDNTRTGAVSIFDKLGAGARDRFDAIKKGISDRVDQTRKNVIDFIDRMRGGAADLIEKMKNGAHERFDQIRQGVTDRVDTMRKNVINLVDNLRSGVANLWDKIKSGAAAFGDAFKNIVVKGVQGAVNLMRKWLGAAALGLASLLDKLGVGPVGELQDVGHNLQEPLQFARGGIARGDKPYVAGEQGEPEAIVNLRRRTPESARAARHVARQYPEAWGRHGRAEDMGGTHVRGRPGGARGQGYSVSPITHYAWAPEISPRVHAIANATGTKPNTYPGHGEPGGSSELYTADFWGSGGRGDPIPKAMGYKTADLAINKYNKAPGVLYVIRQGQYWRGGHWSGNTYGDPHYDHTHVSWDSPGGASASGSSGFDLLGAWNDFKDALPAFPSGGVADLFAGTPGRVLGWIWDWVKSKAGEILTGGGGTNFTGTGMELMRKSLSKYNLPSDWERNSDLWNIAKLESGTTPSDVHFEPNGPSFMAPWGISTNNWAGIHPSSPSFERFALGPRYVKYRYGTPEKAMAFHRAHNWYDTGGIIPGPRGQRQIVEAHAGERVLPINTTRAFDNLADRINRLDIRTRQNRTHDILQNRADLTRSEHELLRKIEHRLEQQLGKMATKDELRDAFVHGAAAFNLSDGGRDIINGHMAASVRRAKELIGQYT